jgi:hypothetical protein
MSTKKGDDSATSRIYVTLPSGAMDLLDQLVGQKIHGADPASIARHLIIQKLDEFLASGRLKLP